MCVVKYCHIWKQYPVQRERDDKNIKICKFWGWELKSLSQKCEERVRKFFFLARQYFKAEIIAMQN